MNALPVLALALPIAGMLTILVAGAKRARGISIGFLIPGVAIAAGIVWSLWQSGGALVTFSGGWRPPLGITLRADGLSAVMMAVTVLVVLAAALYAPPDFDGPDAPRVAFSFRILLLGVWGAMNAVFLGNDLFNLYVALELIAFAGVPLVCLGGKPGTFQAALRYLIFALMGSALYLLGAVLLYGAYGTLDLTLLAERVRPELSVWLAVAVMTAGLAAKTALFPLHLWLPPAHAGAPPAASALLSALVVKGSFFLTVRIWFDLVPHLAAGLAGMIPGALGAGAIVTGGLLALQQDRLKLLIAYSTVAQIGYLFLMFPLAAEPTALPGGMFQAVSHAFAKAAMFMAAGLLAEAAGSDRLSDLRGMGRMLPVTSCAFVLAALSLVGVPPTGGFVTKWLLLSAVFANGQWGWALVLAAGGLLAGGYMFRALAPLFSPGDRKPAATPPARGREWVTVGLAACALLVGMFPQATLNLLTIGRPTVTEAAP